MNLSAIRAVLFDLDGTLYRQRPLRIAMALELATLPCSGPLKAPARLAALRAYRRAQEDLRALGDGHPADAQVHRAAVASGLTVAEVRALVGEWMDRRPLKYLQFCQASGLPGLLDVLEHTGRRAGILSDYPARAKLAALGIADRFDPVLSAADAGIGAFKPSPRGYLRACELWELAPGQVLYVGDRPEVDAAGAQAAGMPCAIVGARGGGNSYWAIASLGELTGALAHAG